MNSYEGQHTSSPSHSLNQNHHIQSLDNASNPASAMLLQQHQMAGPEGPTAVNLWPEPGFDTGNGGLDGHPGLKHEDHSPVGEEKQHPSPWDSGPYDPQLHNSVSRSTSVPLGYATFPPAPNNMWDSYKHHEALDFDPLSHELDGHGETIRASDDSILDLRLQGQGMDAPSPYHNVRSGHHRRISSSCSSLSSGGPAGDTLSLDDLSVPWDPSQEQHDSLNMMSSANRLSASPSDLYLRAPPRPTRQAMSNTSASISPPTHLGSVSPLSQRRREQHRSSPYPNPAGRQWSPIVRQRQQRFSPYGAWESSYQGQMQPGGHATHDLGQPDLGQQSYLEHRHDNCGVQPSLYPDPYQSLHHAPHMMSHGGFRMLQSNAEPITHQRYPYSDLSDPPDLFASLHEEQLPPPEEDMNPSDPDLVPHQQELRFEGDLYTPRWVRGHGNKREGWCGICKPGRWLVLKNSAFWYDKSFSHGISAATGNQFQGPKETRRMDGNPDVWEGLCGSCNDWVPLVSSKKKGTSYYRHAYKCHTHPKVKDAPKRRRETSHTRLLAASSTAKSSPSLSGAEATGPSPYTVVQPKQEGSPYGSYGHSMEEYR